MKLMHMVSGLAVAVALAACADKSADIQTPAPNPNTSATAAQPVIAQPNVSGTVWIRQKVALPPDAVLTEATDCRWIEPKTITDFPLPAPHRKLANKCGLFDKGAVQG